MGSRSFGGCALIIFGLLIFGMLMWAFAVLLYILGFAVLIGGLILGIMLIIHTFIKIGRKRDLDKIDDNILYMTQDCAGSVTSTIADIDYVMHTKGIDMGKDPEEFQEFSMEARTLRRRLEATRVLLESAPSLEHRIDAVIEAEKLLHKSRKLLGDQI